MSLFTAIVTATVFALFGLPYKYYQCWFSFSWVGTVTGTVMYLSLAGGVGGLLGWLGAYLAHAQPTPNLALNGLLYGAAGTLALRAEFRTRSKETAPIEVFSPAIRTSSKGAVGAAGQGQRPVVGDFDHGYSVRVPPRGTWHLRWHMRLTCSDALSGGPCTADPGEKTSIIRARVQLVNGAPRRGVRLAGLRLGHR